MSKFSQSFGLNKSQAELDFVDIPMESDTWLFLDPFALSRRPDAWSQRAHMTLITFFQQVVDSIRKGDTTQARALLSKLSEPNETHLGLSKKRPQGAGIGGQQTSDLLLALQRSTAVKTGFLSSLAECELMVEGIGRDKTSDLTTNIIRSHLIDYTQQQCALHGIATSSAALPPCFDPLTRLWESRYADVPIWKHKPILLVPKVVVRYSPAYDHQHYYRHFVLDFLREEELNSAHSSLVHSLKNGRRIVYKKDLEKQFPCTKAFLYDFSTKHPDVLEAYRERLKQLDLTNPASSVDEENEDTIADALIVALKSIAPGNAQASAYHSLMIGALEFLFFPDLLNPVKEKEIHDGRKRIDIIMENGARHGVLHSLHDIRKLPCSYVPIECKNYSTDVSNPELDQLSGRFSTNRGRFGILCCRSFDDRSLFIKRCHDTLTDDRGLIVPVDDATLIEMLSEVSKKNRRAVGQMLGSLISEVWL